ncbi:glycosyltransferase family 39 protein [Candidatus Microgenomates bacterium]|nr:glycosyltransferase family 39 protein [Candidatus Microgenomates bacterium]
MLLILILAFVLRLVNLNQSFWLDEAAQVIESARPLSAQFSIVSDFHPPLFHLILHFWMMLGNSEVWIRLLPVLLGVATVYLIYKLGCCLGKEREGELAALFLAISPYHLWYSQEARPYMLFVFFSLFSTLMLLRKKWLMYILTTTLLMYSLYFAPFVIIGQFCYLVIFEKKNLRQFLKCLLTVILLFLPWLPEFLRQLEQGTSGFFRGWTDIVSVNPWKAIPLTFAKFIFGKGTINNLFIYTLAVAPVFLIFLYCLYVIRKDRSGKMLSTFFFVPFALAIFVSFFIPVVAPQRLIFLLPLFCLIIAKGISGMIPVGRLLVIFIVVVTGIAGITDYYTNPYVQREEWRQAVEFVEGSGDDKTLVLFVFPSPFAPYLWYEKGTVEAKGIAPKFILDDNDLANLQPEVNNKNRIYLFQYLTGLTDPKEKTRAFLSENGFVNRDTKDFPGVGFVYIYGKE